MKIMICCPRDFAIASETWVLLSYAETDSWVKFIISCCGFLYIGRKSKLLLLTLLQILVATS